MVVTVAVVAIAGASAGSSAAAVAGAAASSLVSKEHSSAGRGLMKHGYREGSSFPKPIGNPTQINEHGQRVLEMILNHPERQFVTGEYKRYGKVMDVKVPGVGGVRYDINGNFIGFLEP